jgi:hypothetical protein
MGMTDMTEVKYTTLLKGVMLSRLISQFTQSNIGLTDARMKHVTRRSQETIKMTEFRFARRIRSFPQSDVVCQQPRAMELLGTGSGPKTARDHQRHF